MWCSLCGWEESLALSTMGLTGRDFIQTNENEFFNHQICNIKFWNEIHLNCNE